MQIPKEEDDSNDVMANVDDPKSVSFVEKDCVYKGLTDEDPGGT